MHQNAPKCSVLSGTEAVRGAVHTHAPKIKTPYKRHTGQIYGAVVKPRKCKEGNITQQLLHLKLAPSCLQRLPCSCLEHFCIWEVM